MEDVVEILKKRRSIRKYKDEMVPDEILDKIIEAGTYAPTGMDNQSPIIIKITNKEVRDKLAKLNAKILGNEKIDTFYGAPVVLVVLANKDTPSYIYDGSLVMGNMMNAAFALGIGSCWIHRAKEEFELPEGKEILRELGITGNYEGIGNCIIGYPAEERQATPRKDSYVYEIK